MFEDASNEVFSDEFVLRVALESCIKRGCTCEPEITIHKEGKAKAASVKHDSWCVVMQEDRAN